MSYLVNPRRFDIVLTRTDVEQIDLRLGIPKLGYFMTTMSSNKRVTSAQQVEIEWPSTYTKPLELSLNQAHQQTIAFASVSAALLSSYFLL